MELNLNLTEVNTLFPFHFAIDAQMKIISVGSSLEKLLPNKILANSFENIFKLKSPLPIEYSFKSITEHLSDLIIVEVLKIPTQLELRGQFLSLENGKVLLFAGSPVLADINDLKKPNLQIKTTIELSGFPEEDPNPVLRYDKEGELIYSNKKSRYFLSLIQKNEFSDQNTLFFKTIIKSLEKNKTTYIEISFDKTIFELVFVPIDNGDSYVNVYATDISVRKKTESALKESEQRLGVLYEATKLFSDNNSVTENFETILQLICTTYNWECAGYWQIENDQTLINTAYYCAKNNPFQEYYLNTTTKKIPIGKGLIGKAWQEKKIKFIKDVITSNSFFSAKEASEFGDFIGFAFPIIIKNKVVGVFDFFDQNLIEPDNRIINLLEALGLLIVKYLERVEAENDLKSSEEKYRLIVESASQIIFKINEHGRFTFVNPVTLKITGYSEEELLDKSFLSLVRIDYREQTLEFYRKQLSEKTKTTYFEFPIINKHGEEKWIGQNVQMSEFFKNKNDIISLASDITERINTQTELTSALSRLSSLITNLNTGILLENANRKIVIVNEIFCKTFDIPVPADQLIGSDCSDSAEQVKYLFVNEVEFVNNINVIIKNRKKVIGEIVVMKDGRVFERNFIPVFADNKYLGHLWQYKDVTESVNYGKKINEQKRFYETILNSIPEDLVVFDKDQKYLFINPTSVKDETMRKWLIGKDDFEYCAFANKDIAMAEGRRDVFNQAVKTKKNVELNEKLKNSKGEIEYHYRVMNPIFNEQNELVFVIGYGVNVTKIKIAELQLQEAKELAENSSKTKEQFLANMSHEIRTPMNAIVGMTSLLKETKLDSKQSDFLNSIERSSKNLLVIIDDVLDLTKISAGKLSIENVGFKLNLLVSNILKDLYSKAEGKGIDLHYSISDNIDEILIGDPVRLGQVFLNLLNNSIKFTSTGSVKLECKLQEKTKSYNQILFSIIDTGIGIEQSKLENVFESFTQEDASTTRKFGGTGLGLTISRQIVKLFGSDIIVESKKGIGSNFHFEIKLPVGNLKDIPIEEFEIVNYESLAGLKLLLVEDHEMNQILAKTILESWNINTTIANNGLEAIGKLKNETFDLILMDIQMPLLNGYETTKLIRNELMIKVPIIALTANAIQGDNEKCIAAGMNDYISKPFDKRILFKKIAKLVLG